MPILFVTLIFLIANGLLWQQRPPGGIWLAASVVLALIWGAVFFRLVTHAPERKN